MRKLFKILAWSIGVLLVVLSVFIAGLYYYVNSASFQQHVIAQINAATEYELSIDGELKWSIFPWVGVRITEVNLSNAPSFTEKDLLHVQEADVRFRLLPLLSKRFEFSKVIFRGVDVNLEVNAQGEGNWLDLLQDSADESDVITATSTEVSEAELIEASEGLPKAKVRIAGVVIESGNFTWRDQRSGQFVALNNINAEVSELTPDKPFAISLAMHVASQQPQLQGQVNFNGEVHYTPVKGGLTVKNLQSVIKLEGAELPNQQLQMVVEGDLKANYLAATLDLATLSVKTLDTTLTAKLSGKQLFSQPELQGEVSVQAEKPKQLLQLFMPEMQFAHQQAFSKLSLSSPVTFTQQQLHLSKLQGQLDSSSIDGSVKVRNFSQPQVNFTLAVNQINVDHYLPKTPETKKASTKNTSKIKTTNNSGGNDESIHKLLRQLNLNGSASIGQLTVKQIPLNQVKVALNTKDGLLKLTSSSAAIYQGSYQGTGSLDVRGKQAKLAFNGRLRQVPLEKIIDLSEYDLPITQVTGKLNATADVTARGLTLAAIKQSLGGYANVDVNNGVIDGIDIGYYMRVIANETAKLAQKPTFNVGRDGKRTSYQTLVLKNQFDNNGSMQNDIALTSGELHATIQGKMHLVTEKMDYRFTGYIDNPGSDRILKQYLQLPLMVRIMGTLHKPKVVPDFDAIVQYLIKEKINEEINKGIQKLLGL
jgi:AsmA protein